MKAQVLLLFRDHDKYLDKIFGFGDYALSYIDKAKVQQLHRYFHGNKVKSKFGSHLKSIFAGIEQINVNLATATGGLVPIDIKFNPKQMRKNNLANQSDVQKNWNQVQQIKSTILALQKQLQAARQDFESIMSREPNLMDRVNRGQVLDSFDTSLISVKGILIRNKGDLSHSTDASFLLSQYPYRMTRKGDPLLKLEVSEDLNTEIGPLEWHPFVKITGIMGDKTHLQVLAISAKTAPTIDEMVNGIKLANFFPGMLYSRGVDLFEWHSEVEETTKKINNYQWLDKDIYDSIDIPKLKLSGELIRIDTIEPDTYLEDFSRSSEDTDKSTNSNERIQALLQKHDYKLDPKFRIIYNRARQKSSFKENEAECSIHEDYAHQLLLLKWIFSRNDTDLLEDPRFSEGAKKLEDSLKMLKSCLTKNNIRSRIPDEF